IPIYTISSKEVPESSRGGYRKSIDLLYQDMEALERKLEEGQIDRNRYKDDMKDLRVQMLESYNYSEDNMFIVKIESGGIGHSYRSADVLIEMGRKYILFILRDINEQRTMVLFPWNLDVYPDELHIRDKILQTLEKQTSK